MDKTTSGGRAVGNRWPGGYARKTGRGLVYVIEREVAGVRYHVSTRAHSLRAAMAQLERFEASPASYRPGGDDGDRPVRITAELVAAWKAWSLERGRTARHVSYQVGYLAAWAEDLRGDLRAVRLADLKAAVERRKTCRQQRIAAIKAFCAWLRTERGLLLHANDASLDLKVPQSRPEQLKRVKAVAIEDVEAVLLKLRPESRHALAFLARTGWHVQELRRWAAAPDTREIEGGVVVTTKHKSGKAHSTEIRDPIGLEAVRFIAAAGCIPSRFSDEVGEACRAAGVERFGPGQMRHTVSTWADDGGATDDQMRRFFGWADYRTGQRFYVKAGKAPGLVRLPPLRLVR